MGSPRPSDHDVGLESGGEPSSKTRIGVVGSNDEAMIGQGCRGGEHGDHQAVDMEVDAGQASRQEEKEGTSQTVGYIKVDGDNGHGSCSLGGGEEAASGSGRGSLPIQGCVLPREKLSEHHAYADVKDGGRGEEEPAKEVFKGGGASDEPGALSQKQKQKPSGGGHGSLDVGQGIDATMKSSLCSRAIRDNGGGSLVPAKRPAPTAYRYKCLVCNVDLRVDLPEGTGSFRCIECRAVYVVVNTDGREEELAQDADWPMPAREKRERREGGHGEGVQKDAPLQAARYSSSSSHGPRKYPTKRGGGTAENASSVDAGGVPKQPRELTGYQQFMKDNVVRVKNENPTWPHRDAFRHASLMWSSSPLNPKNRPGTARAQGSSDGVGSMDVEAQVDTDYDGGGGGEGGEEAPPDEAIAVGGGFGGGRGGEHDDGDGERHGDDAGGQRGGSRGEGGKGKEGEDGKGKEGEGGKGKEGEGGKGKEGEGGKGKEGEGGKGKEGEGGKGKEGEGEDWGAAVLPQIEGQEGEEEEEGYRR